MYSLALPQQNRISSAELFSSHSPSIKLSPSAFLTLFITLSALSAAQSVETFSLAHSHCGKKSSHSICVCVCVYTYTCVWERESEKWEREWMYLSSESVPLCDGRYHLQNRGASRISSHVVSCCVCVFFKRFPPVSSSPLPRCELYVFYSCLFLDLPLDEHF